VLNEYNFFWHNAWLLGNYKTKNLSILKMEFIMKTKALQLVVLLSALSLSIVTQAAVSVLNISTKSNAFFTVAIDNYQYPNYTNNFTSQGIDAGNHFISVTSSRSGYNMSINRNIVLYQGWISINPCEELNVCILPGGNVALSRRSLAPLVVPQCGTQPYNYNSYPNNYDYNTQNYQYDYSNYNTICAMNSENFFQLKQVIANRWFDSSKLESAKLALNQNYISSSQLYELMMLLDFESSKLDLAKYAYERVIDKQNVFRIYNAFDFDSSISSFNHYIN